MKHLINKLTALADCPAGEISGDAVELVIQTASGQSRRTTESVVQLASDAVKSLSELLMAIRNADSLEELQRMVGPSTEEGQANVARPARLDHYYDLFGVDHNDWPEHAKALLAAQTRFESTYC